MVVIAILILSFTVSLRPEPKTIGNYSDTKVIPGHAHNDYENENPLHDALKNGFISVEADVHLLNDQLYVSHDHPKELKPEMTLKSLYLDPLKKHIARHNGHVYTGYKGPFYLMIDFKTAAGPTYKKLKSILKDYLSMLSLVEDGVEKKRPVKIFISGNRPFKEVLNDEPKLVGLDGRPRDLDKNIPASIMPVVSDHYFNILSWMGEGKIHKKALNKFKKLVEETHAQGKKLRLWAAPDIPAVWRFLLEHDVDLINTDRVEAYREFYMQYNALNSH